MFKITCFLQSSDHETKISVSGQSLVVDGTPIDFSALGEGEQCDTELPLVGKVRRIGGVVEVGVRFRYSTETAEPIQSTNQDDYIVTLSSGALPDIIRRKPVVEVPPMMETAENAEA